MAQTQRLTSYKCAVHEHEICGSKVTSVVYHNTAIVNFDERSIRLNSGGWRTKKTKDDMNRASNQFDLGYTVFQKDFDWFVATAGETIPFVDHMCINR